MAEVRTDAAKIPVEIAAEIAFGELIDVKGDEREVGAVLAVVEIALEDFAEETFSSSGHAELRESDFKWRRNSSSGIL